MIEHQFSPAKIPHVMRHDPGGTNSVKRVIRKSNGDYWARCDPQSLGISFLSDRDVENRDV